MGSIPVGATITYLRFLMNNQDIRWKQRFDNFDKAFERLSEAMSQSSLNELELSSLLRRSGELSQTRKPGIQGSHQSSWKSILW